MLPPPFHNALVLTGPTGSGKTELALRLAETHNAEIISMDSMALYRGMDIGTAKPTREERARVPHHLVDVLDPWQSANVAWWLEQARDVNADILARGKQVLFVGGTPLYLKAMLFGLFDAPPADAVLRWSLAAQANAHGSAAMHQRLAEVDPVTAARLHPNDTRRILRALEIFETSGRPLSQWQTQWSQIVASATDETLPPRIVWLDWPRSVLYERINRRVERMFADGLVDEVARLKELPEGLSREARQALGYKEVLAFLERQATLPETIAQVQTRTRNFAKRQVTWFRHLPHCRPATYELTLKWWQSTMR